MTNLGYVYQAKIKRIEKLLKQCVTLRKSMRKYYFLNSEVRTYIVNYIQREVMYMEKLSPHRQENTLAYMKYLEGIHQVIEEDMGNRKIVLQNLLRGAAENST